MIILGASKDKARQFTTDEIMHMREDLVIYMAERLANNDPVSQLQRENLLQSIKTIKEYRHSKREIQNFRP